MATNIGSTTLRAAPLRDMTITVTLSRGFRGRLWLSRLLLRALAWVGGVTVVEEVRSGEPGPPAFRSTLPRPLSEPEVQAARDRLLAELRQPFRGISDERRADIRAQCDEARRRLDGIT